MVRVHERRGMVLDIPCTVKRRREERIYLVDIMTVSDSHGAAD